MMMAIPTFTEAQTLPRHWRLLTDDDKRDYAKLREVIRPLTLRTSRAYLATNFTRIMNHIREYSIHHDAGDWRRCLICGIAWLDDGIAISTRQLKLLVGKCRSSVNAGFESIGYRPVPMSPQLVEQLMATLPCLVRMGNEVRQWTIRVPGSGGGSDSAHEDEGLWGIEYFDLTQQTLMNEDFSSMEREGRLPE
jgi:hypothetical protein